MVLGAAFGTIIKSLVADVLMPPIGLLMGGVDFANLFIVLKEGQAVGAMFTVADAKAAGAVTINYGIFINNIICFIFVAFALFMVIRRMNKMKREEEAPPAEPTTKDCPHCLSSIPIKAIRCGHCTSDLRNSA